MCNLLSIHWNRLFCYNVLYETPEYKEFLNLCRPDKSVLEYCRDEVEYEKAEDWEKSHEKRDIYADELTHPAWLEREVYEVCPSIDPEETKGTQNVSFSGVARRKYWYSKEMERDERMQALIAKYSGVENEKG